MNTEQITILMATYNGEKYLDAQIHSILNQTYQNFQLIICDDLSKDETKKLIEKFAKSFPDKIKIIDSSINQGAIQNFSFLMQHATTDYVMFADQDDIWMQDKVEKSYLEMKSLEKVHGNQVPLLVHTDLTVVDQNLNILGQSFWKYTNLKPHLFSRMNRFLVQNVVTGCTMLLNRPLYELARPVPECALMHDWWIGLTAATFGKIGIVNAPTILYRQHGSNTLGAKKFQLFKVVREGFKAYTSKDRTLQKKMNARQNQAKAFFEKYGDKLNSDQLHVIQDYLKFHEYSSLKKRYMVIKHGFYRSETMINCLLFLIGAKP